MLSWFTQLTLHYIIIITLLHYHIIIITLLLTITSKVSLVEMAEVVRVLFIVTAYPGFSKKNYVSKGLAEDDAGFDCSLEKQYLVHRGYIADTWTDGWREAERDGGKEGAGWEEGKEGQMGRQTERQIDRYQLHIMNVWRI